MITKNTKLKLTAACAFGLEAVTSRELKALGYDNPVVENGRVSFNGTFRDIAVANIWLRSAERVMIELGKFRATDFEEIFQGTRAIPWEDIFPADANMHVTGKSVRSTLKSVPDCQAVAKKAIIEAMKRRYQKTVFPETGPHFRIEVSLLNDTATVGLDTTGEGLHRRGYRQEAGEAPIKETLAAGIILLSGWRSQRPFADPMCGSGTIAIEAAMIGKNIAPGLSRRFAAEKWGIVSVEMWRDVRQEARGKALREEPAITASDRDGGVLKKARANAKRAGVDSAILFRQCSVEDFASGEKGGVIICNPPYGERLSEDKEVGKLYNAMGQSFMKLDEWNWFILSAHPQFERFFGRKADRNRKLYNGKIRCYLYEYFNRPRR